MAQKWGRPPLYYKINKADSTALPKVKMSQSTLCQSSQYRAIQNLYADLVEAIYPEIQNIMAKAFSKNIIGKELLDISMESSITANHKAKMFMSAIVSRIKLDSNAFDVFLKLLKKVESLEYMQERLEQEVANLQRESASNLLSDDTTDVQSDTQQLLPNLDPSEEIELIAPAEENSDLEEPHDMRQGEEGQYYTAKEIQFLNKRYFSLGQCYTVYLLLAVSLYAVGTVGIGLGVRIIAGMDDCKSVSITVYGKTQLIGLLNAGYGAFVLLVGVSLNLIATFFALLTPYLCCRLFGKCQHRGWRVPLCIGALLGICGLITAGATAIYSVIAGASFYPLTQQEFEIPYCFRIHYYSTFVFLLITHVLTSVVAAVCLIAFLIKCIFALIKCTIFSN